MYFKSIVTNYNLKVLFFWKYEPKNKKYSKIDNILSSCTFYWISFNQAKSSKGKPWFGLSLCQKNST